MICLHSSLFRLHVCFFKNIISYVKLVRIGSFDRTSKLLIQSLSSFILLNRDLDLLSPTSSYKGIGLAWPGLAWSAKHGCTAYACTFFFS